MNITGDCCKGRARCGASVLLAVLGSTAALGGEWQDATDIRVAAEQAAVASVVDPAATVRAEAAPLDARLRMPACDVPLTASLPARAQDSARVSAEVRCEGTRPWRLHVPVRVTLTKTVVISAAPLERGKLLTASDVILAQRDVTAAPTGYLTAIEAVVGRELRRGLPAGAVVVPALLESPILVRRGQAVTLEARSGAIAVQMAGVARSDGALGQMIPVENISSRKVLQGTVKNEKYVQIMLP